jgi:hypothetical protein
MMRKNAVLFHKNCIFATKMRKKMVSLDNVRWGIGFVLALRGG